MDFRIPRSTLPNVLEIMFGNVGGGITEPKLHWNEVGESEETKNQPKEQVLG